MKYSGKSLIEAQEKANYLRFSQPCPGPAMVAHNVYKKRDGLQAIPLKRNKDYVFLESDLAEHLQNTSTHASPSSPFESQ